MPKKLFWRTEQRRVCDLLPFKANPRKMSEKEISDLTKSLKKFDLVEIPAITPDNKIIAGHQRCAVLQLLGRSNEFIDCRVPSRPLTEAEYKQYLITSNKVHGTWDYELLAENFEIDTLLDSGFDTGELADAFADIFEVEDDDFDTEAELAKIKKPKSKFGEIYQLGPHKIACMDSLDPETVKRLIGDTKIDLIYCDPIFNIGWNYDKKKYGGKVNDSKTDSEYKEFIRKSLVNALSAAKPNCHCFYWCDQKYIGLIQQLYQELGVENKRVCLWVKNSQNPVPGVAFNKCYEPCVYGIRGKPFLTSTVQNLNEVLNKEMGTGNELLEQIAETLDIWLQKRLAGQKYIHATEKPPTLHEKPIKRCTRPGDTILDLFSGSSSTLVAAESLKRIAYLVDIEPRFVDLGILRYEKLTGIKAKLIHAY